MSLTYSLAAGPTYPLEVATGSLRCKSFVCLIIHPLIHSFIHSGVHSMFSSFSGRQICLHGPVSAYPQPCPHHSRHPPTKRGFQNTVRPRERVEALVPSFALLFRVTPTTVSCPLSAVVASDLCLFGALWIAATASLPLMTQALALARGEGFTALLEQAPNRVWVDTCMMCDSRAH